MSKSSFLIRQSLFHRQRRHIAGSSSQQTSTSPQRSNVAAPKLVAAVRPFNDIPGPIALPMLRHSAHVLPRIGSYHHTVGLGLLEGLRDKYGDLVRLAKASRTRPVLYVFDPEMMREVYESYATEPPRFEKSPLCEHRKGVGHCPVHGDETKAIWAAIRALLQDGSLLRSYDKVFDDIAADATRRLGDLRHAENALNEEMETEIYRWAIETIGVMIFGIRLGCLDGAVHIPTPDNQKPEKTSLDDEIHDLCSLSKRSLEELTPAERLVRCSRDIADGSYQVRSEATLNPENPTFNRALKTFDRHFSLTEHFLIRALHSLSSGELRPEQVLLDKLRPLQRRILPLAADILLAGVDPVSIPYYLIRALHSLSSGELRPEQVLLDKLRPLQRRILPLAADILLAGVDPVSIPYYLIRALHSLSSGELRPEQVLLDKLRPLQRRILPLAADILLAGVDPVSIPYYLIRALHSLSSGELRPEQVLLDKLRPLQRRILPLAADILLAGVDPLAQTALHMFYQLSLHAARQQRAHDEVHWSIASRDAGAATPDLPYVAACAREAMRLHPATGGVVRRNREAIVVGGYEIPAGVDIVLAHGVTSKSEKQWGRANAFVPERWCNEGWEPLKASRAHPLASMPFGEACPATGIVGKMLAALTTRVLDKYRLEWHGPMPSVATVGVNRLHPPYYFVLQNAA